MMANTISSPFIKQAQPRSLVQRLALSLYEAIRRLDSDILLIKKWRTFKENPITLVCISDTHNTKPASLPNGDVLLHAGDLSQYGTFGEIQNQLDWLDAQSHEHKVVIAGNHDLLLDTAFTEAHPDRELNRHPGQRRTDLRWGSVKYLENESVTLHIKGKNRFIRIFGSPWTPRFGNWAFQYDPKQEKGPLDSVLSLPPEVDVVLVHGPPKEHLDDGGKGCELLLGELWKNRPPVVVCGHIHAGRGEEVLSFDSAQKAFENVMLRNNQCLSLVTLVFCFLWAILKRLLGIHPEDSTLKVGQTHLINAAVVGGHGNTEQREPITIVI